MKPSVLLTNIKHASKTFYESIQLSTANRIEEAIRYKFSEDHLKRNLYEDGASALAISLSVRNAF